MRRLATLGLRNSFVARCRSLPARRSSRLGISQLLLFSSSVFSQGAINGAAANTRKTTADLYKVCPSYEDALDVYREMVGEPHTIREEAIDGGVVWWIDRDSTGAACIVRYTLEGPLEEVG